MNLVFAGSASMTLRAIQPKLAGKMLEALAAIAADPFAPHPNAKPLVGGDNEFRLRVGDWWIAYVRDRAADTMTATVIDTRGGVVNAIKPIAETADTVTLSRADFEALQEALEDAADLAESRTVMARIAAGGRSGGPATACRRQDAELRVSSHLADLVIEAAIKA
jgi:hypothetical protein